MTTTRFQPRLSRRQALGALAAGTALSAMSRVMAQSDTSLDIWQRARAQWLLNPRIAYFDTATQGPELRMAVATQYRLMEQQASDPATSLAARHEAGAVTELLSKVGSFLGVSSDEVCLLRNAQEGLQRAFELLALAPGDEVVLAAQCSMALHDYWQQRARRDQLLVTVVHLPVPVSSPEQVTAAFLQALTPRTRLMCMSHVQPMDGAVLPVAALCALARERNVISAVDGSLALGAIPSNLRDIGCDVYAANGCHWLHAPPATAVLSVRASLQNAWPQTAMDNPSVPVAQRARWPMLQRRWARDLVEFSAAMQLWPMLLAANQSWGAAAIEQRLRQLHVYLRLNIRELNDYRVLTPTHPALFLPMLTLSADALDVTRSADWLQRNDNVIVGVASHDLAIGRVLRIALNAANSFDDLDRLIQGLRRTTRL